VYSYSYEKNKFHQRKTEKWIILRSN
jgi:hypothetical protein